MTTHLTDLSAVDDVREGLALLADVILPGTERLPAGREVGAHQDLLDQVLTADPALVAPLTEAGRRAQDGRGVTLDELQTWDAEVLEPAVFALTAAYYMSRTVQRALGYPGPGPRPIAQATPDESYSEELLAPVRRRGSIYVEAPQ
jgi:hypothetical protein